MVQACNDWLRLGPMRSIPKLIESWGDHPLASNNTLRRYSTHFGWMKRAEKYDGRLEAAKNEVAAKRAEEIMNTGIALAHERMAKLQRLEAFLEEQLYHEDPDRPEYFRHDKLWLLDVKIVGQGESARAEKVFRFNDRLIDQYRGVHDDAAKEVGGRKQMLEHSGPAGGPIPFREVVVYLPTETPEDAADGD